MHYCGVLIGERDVPIWPYQRSFRELLVPRPLIRFHLGNEGVTPRGGGNKKGHIPNIINRKNKRERD